jgi:uncharacterized membrane protein YkvA (DUF1232 family)
MTWNPFRRDRAKTTKAGANPTAPSAPVAAETIRPEDFVGPDATRNETVVREGFLDKARRYARHLPMATEIVAMYFCMIDPKTPIWVKGTLAAALAYFILPLDAIPDILPMVGMSDDVTVLSAALAAVSTHITTEHQEKARAWLHAEKLTAAAGAKGA